MTSISQYRVAILFVVLLVAVQGTAAAETQVRPTVTVPSGTVLNDDLTAAAGTVVIEGTVDGDVTALASEVIVVGEVRGDVVTFAGRAVVTGAVLGDVRTFGGVTQVDGDVDGDLSSVGGSTTVGGRVGGDVDVRGILVDVQDDATIGGRIQTTAVRTQVNGTVGASASSAANATLLTLPTPRIEATVGSGSTTLETLSGAESVTAATGATTASTASSVGEGRFTPQPVSVAAIPLQLLPGDGAFDLSLFDLYRFGVNALLGVLVVWAFPRFSNTVASEARTRPLRTAFYGVALLLVGPAVLLFLGLSLLGLPLALAGALLLSVVSWVGSVLGRFAVGMWVLSLVPRVFDAADREAPDVENRWLGLLVGFAVVGVLIRLPVVGVAFDTVVLVLGVGAMTFLGVAAYRRSERTPSHMTVTETADVADVADD